jgi:release factor glutamine methyltransferase
MSNLPTIQAALAQAGLEPLDAELLLALALNAPRSTLRAWPQRVLTPQQAWQFEQLARRRQAGEPLAYLTGRKEFWSLELQVSPDVLVPRPETELLVELALQRLPADQPARVIDLGTGSGAVALALASERPAWQVVGIDRSPAALRIARANAVRLRLERVAWLAGDWLKPINPAWQADLIVSNPPYLAAADPHWPDLQYEPRLALLAAEEGLAALREIIATAHSHLAAGGWLGVEHGYEQGAAARQLFAGYVAARTHLDLAGLPRVTWGQKAES